MEENEVFHSFDLRLFAISAIANVDIGEQYYSSVRTVSTAYVT